MKKVPSLFAMRHGVQLRSGASEFGTLALRNAGRSMHRYLLSLHSGDPLLLAAVSNSFTARDGTNRVLADGKNANTIRLGDVMTPNPTTMSSDMTALDAFRLMRKGGFRHVPVVDRGELKGIVSRGDFHAAEQYSLDEELKLWEDVD